MNRYDTEWKDVPMRRAALLIIALIVGATLLAGCSDNGGGGEAGLHEVGAGVATEGRPVMWEFYTDS
ncbi:MAG: hypothetical protein Kow0067_16290 [Coriobacteriia bacterium]